MKKFLAIAIVAIMIVTMGACNSSKKRQEQVKAAVEKVNQGDSLTQAEYAVSISYMKDAINDLAPVLKDKNRKPGELQKKISELNQKYPDAEQVLKIVEENQDNLDPETRKLYDEFQKLKEATFEGMKPIPAEMQRIRRR